MRLATFSLELEVNQHLDPVTSASKCACHESITDADISTEKMTHSTVSRGDSVPLYALLKPHIIVGKCRMRRDEDWIYATICIE